MPECCIPAPDFAALVLSHIKMIAIAGPVVQWQTWRSTAQPPKGSAGGSRFYFCAAKSANVRFEFVCPRVRVAI